MAALDMKFVTFAIPNPVSSSGKEAQMVSANISYNEFYTTGFQTLSQNNPNNYNPVKGLFYVPTLVHQDACVNLSSQYIPSNVTTMSSFPTNQNWPFIAVFPWTTPNCVQAYLSQARADAVYGILTFLPGNNSATPPGPADNAWNLQDGGAWRNQNQFPIFAASTGIVGSLLLALDQYSGSAASAPYGPQLLTMYDPHDYIRLFGEIDLPNSSNVPSLWIFLIIVLAVLLGIVFIASIIMHIVQRHQRANLQRRLERGDVDLETLGIKKMNVPQEQIDQMPRHVYVPSPEAEAELAQTSGRVANQGAIPTDTVHEKSAGVSAAIKYNNLKSGHVTSFSQPTCAICLDDFVPHETVVRELPCKHIFHPECIDLFLRDSSSLCPICKKSTLPAGYCPVKVTNLMVRRERLVRRMRERRAGRNALNSMGSSASTRNTRPGSEPVYDPSGLASQHVPADRIEAVQMYLARMLRIGEGLPTAQSAYENQVGREAGPRSTVISRSEAARRQTSPGHVEAGLHAVPEEVEMGSVPSETGAGTSNSVPPSSAMNFANRRRDTVQVPDDIAAQGASARRAWRRQRLAQQQESQFSENAELTRAADMGRPLWRRMVGRVVPGLD